MKEIVEVTLLGSIADGQRFSVVSGTPYLKIARGPQDFKAISSDSLDLLKQPIQLMCDVYIPEENCIFRYHITTQINNPHYP